MTARNSILNRHLADKLRSVLKYSRIVNVIGPRQVGKTTLVKDLLHTGRFITLDDPVQLDAMRQDPVGQLAALTAERGSAPLIIDEAQRLGDMALAIKMIVDANWQPGQFVLTGSSNIFSTMAVSDSLAGRMRTLKLWPMAVAETKSRPPSRILDWALSKSPALADLPEKPNPASRADYIDLILRGGFPGIRNLPLQPLQEAYRNHIDAIVDRDVADLLRVRKTDALRKLIMQLAVRTGEAPNIADICKLVGVQRQTLDQYRDVLLRLSVITQLGAWTSGEHHREIRRAKNHFVDTGMAAALRSLTPRSFDADANPTALGGLLESFVLSELFRAAPFQEHKADLYHWRDMDGREIDILAESAHRLATIEIKASATASRQDFKHADWFAAEGPGRKRSVVKVVFYLGERMMDFGDRRFALPVSCLWSEPAATQELLL